MRWKLGFDTAVFSRNLSEIQEFDYGDFMRAANSYLVDLRQELGVLEDKSINQRLMLMQTYLQFKPNWDINSTRTKLIKDTRYLDELLRGHDQDWESPSSTYRMLNPGPIEQKVYSQ